MLLFSLQLNHAQFNVRQSPNSWGGGWEREIYLDIQCMSSEWPGLGQLPDLGDFLSPNSLYSSSLVASTKPGRKKEYRNGKERNKWRNMMAGTKYEV